MPQRSIPALSMACTRNECVTTCSAPQQACASCSVVRTRERPSHHTHSCEKNLAALVEVVQLDRRQPGHLLHFHLGSCQCLPTSQA
jgi:hypothetical protein